MSLQDKLEAEQIKLGQNVKDRKSLEADGEVIAKGIEELMDKIADSEVTYSIGDRFCQEGNFKKILAEAGNEKGVDLIGLGSGDNYSGHPTDVEDIKRITKAELNRIFSGNAHM
jgi:hypothetical protein